MKSNHGQKILSTHSNDWLFIIRFCTHYYEYDSVYFIAYHLTKQERIKTLARWTWTIWYRKKSHIRPMSMNWFLLIFRRNGWLTLKGDFSERWYFLNVYSQTVRVLKHHTIRIWSIFDILFMLLTRIIPIISSFSLIYFSLKYF